MKKFLLLVAILLIAYGCYYCYSNFVKKEVPPLTIEEDVINIDKFFIYGNHLNLHGSLVDDDKLDLILYDGNFLSFEIDKNDDGFSLSKNVNDGILLDDIPVGKYFMFLRSNNVNEKGDTFYKYYSLNNTTDYKETIFYTFSSVGNKIIIDTDDVYNTLTLNVNKEKNNDVYDVVVDPGHGGMDSGASKNGHKESDFTMQAAISLKEKLEEYGVRVKLTREEGQLTANETLPNYGINGRAVIPHNVKAKYIFSLHLNSSNYATANGLEIYTAQNINYDFAKQLVKNITDGAQTNISKNPVNKVYDGVYTRMFTQSDINGSIKEYKQKNMNPYNITTNSNYYYMIRETGGIVTGAYVDDRNEEVGSNPYYNSNIGCETYLIELGYITNKSDVNNIENALDKYTTAIANTFKQIFVND